MAVGVGAGVVVEAVIALLMCECFSTVAGVRIPPQGHAGVVPRPLRVVAINPDWANPRVQIQRIKAWRPQDCTYYVGYSPKGCDELQAARVHILLGTYRCYHWHGSVGSVAIMLNLRSAGADAGRRQTADRWTGVEGEVLARGAPQDLL